MQIDERIWTFPSSHTLKIVGSNPDVLREQVISILNNLHVSFDHSSIFFKPSKAGKYHSMSVLVNFNEKYEVENLFAALASCEHVIWAA
ncbi:MAG: DUF493 domain-containing protein [Pseudomonadota bacterium]